MALDISDGYTIGDTTPATDANGEPIPVVSYAYRPAMPKALYNWRYRLKTAMSGADELAATADFIAAHIVRWDVIQNRQPAKVTPENVAALPEPILNHIAGKVATWAGKRPETKPDESAAPTAQETAEKNSHSA